MSARTRRFAIALLIGVVTLAACDGQPAVPSSNTQPTLPAVSNGENSGEGGVEAALVTYSDAAQGFSIGYPGPWTQDKSITSGVKFVGADSSLALDFVTPPAGTDAMTYVQNDVAWVSAAFPGCKQLSLAPSILGNPLQVLSC